LRSQNETLKEKQQMSLEHKTIMNESSLYNKNTTDQLESLMDERHKYKQAYEILMEKYANLKKDNKRLVELVDINDNN